MVQDKRILREYLPLVLVYCNTQKLIKIQEFISFNNLVLVFQNHSSHFTPLNIAKCITKPNFSFGAEKNTFMICSILVSVLFNFYREALII